MDVTVVIDCQDGEPNVNLARLASTVQLMLDAGVEVILTSAIEIGHLLTLKVLHMPGSSLADRWNVAVQRASGELVGFTVSSLLFSPSWPRIAEDHFDQDRTLALLFGTTIPNYWQPRRLALRALQSRNTNKSQHHDGTGQTASTFLQEGPEEPSVFFVRRCALLSNGGFQEASDLPAAFAEAKAALRCESYPAKQVRETSELQANDISDIDWHSLMERTQRFAHQNASATTFISSIATTFGKLLVCLVGITLTLEAGRGRFEKLATIQPLVAMLALLIAYLIVTIHSVGRPLASNGSKMHHRWAVRVRAGLLASILRLVYSYELIIAFLSANHSKHVDQPGEHNRLRLLIMNWRDIDHPSAGGAESYIVALAKHWVQAGHEVALLTQRHPNSSRIDFAGGMTTYRVGGKRTLYVRAALFYVSRLRNKYDIVIDCENGIPFFAPLYTRKPVILLVHHVHQEVFKRYLPVGVRNLACWVEGALMPFAYRSHPVVAVSSDTRDELLTIGFKESQITIVKNGVQLPAHAVESARSASAKPSIICIGRLKKQKSIDLLITALRSVIDKVGEVSLDIVGQGPELAKLQELAQKHDVSEYVHFHGFVPQEKLDDLLAKAWLLVNPSAYEGWGQVCMEASAMGLPVVASNVRGLRESVRDGITGLLFEYGDTDALAQSIITVIDDASLRKSLGEEGRHWASLHGWDTSARLFLRLAKEVTGGNVTPIALPDSGVPEVIDLASIERQRTVSPVPFRRATLAAEDHIDQYPLS